MSRPANAGDLSGESSSDQGGRSEDSDGRLLPNRRISSRMKPFINRMKLQLKDHDLTDPASVARLKQYREDMWRILKKRKVCRTIADQIIAETLDAAANHRLESLRRQQNIEYLAQANSNRILLIQHVEHLVLMLAKLPRAIKIEINKIMIGPNWRETETESFVEFMAALLAALAKMPATRFTVGARSSIVDSSRSRNDRIVTKFKRTAPPAIIELWESIPAVTRTQVESELRAWASTTKRSVVGFLNHLVALLKQNPERIGRGPHLAIESRYVHALAAIWRRHGLESAVGLAFNFSLGNNGKNVESAFQRFGCLALAAVGDRSNITRWQVAKFKSQSKMRSGKDLRH